MINCCWRVPCPFFSTGTIQVYTPHASDIRCPSTQKSAVWPWTSSSSSSDFVTLQGTHLLTNTGVLTYTGKYALQDIPYLLDEPRVSSTNCYNGCTYRNSKPQTQTHSYFLTLWCQILERTIICCINVFHMTCLVLRLSSKGNTQIYYTAWLTKYGIKALLLGLHIT